MHDFNCTQADDMNFELMAERTRYLKENPKGVQEMCKVMEDMRNEAALDYARETARRMIKDGELPLEKIAHYVPPLSMDELKELEAEVIQPA